MSDISQHNEKWAFAQIISGQQVRKIGWPADHYALRIGDNIHRRYLPNSEESVEVCFLSEEKFCTMFSNSLWEVKFVPLDMNKISVLF